MKYNTELPWGIRRLFALSENDLRKSIDSLESEMTDGSATIHDANLLAEYRRQLDRIVSVKRGSKSMF